MYPLLTSKKAVYMLAALLLVVQGTLYLLQFENVPYAGDEYRVIFEFLLQNENGLQLASLFDTNNEHINVTARAIAWENYLLFGEFQFYSLYVVGFLSYVAFAALLVRRYIREATDSLQALSAILILFFFGYHSVMAFALVGVQYFLTSLCALLALWLALRSDDYKGWLLSFAFALIATFTFGNGLFSFFVIALLLWKQGKTKPALFFAVSFVVLLAAYLKLFSLSQPHTALYGNPYVLGRYLVHLGGLLLGEEYIYTTFCIGLGTLTIFAFVTWKFLRSPELKHPIIHGLFFYFLITLLSITFSRHAKGIMDVFKLRYAFFTVMTLSTGVFLLMRYVSVRRTVSKAIAATAVLICVGSFALYQSDFFTWKKDRFYRVERYQNTGRGLWPDAYWNEDGDRHISEVMRQVEEKGLFDLPEVPPAEDRKE